MLLQPNPFFDLLEVVRGPLLGTLPDGLTCLGAVLYSLACAARRLGVLCPCPRPRRLLAMNAMPPAYRNPSISIEAVSVSFPLYHGNARSLKKMVLAAASGRLGQDRKQRIVVEALRNISFRLRGGDRLGLIGSNGAGKTTLLRTLAGIYEPVTGHVRVEGSLNALLDPGLWDEHRTDRAREHPAARPL